MRRSRPDDRDPFRFAPRVTLTLLGGLAIFLLISLLYVLPVLFEPLPPGAIPDYRRERVAARLEGKVIYLLVGSLLVATAPAIRRGRARLPRRERP